MRSETLEKVKHFIQQYLLIRPRFSPLRFVICPHKSSKGSRIGSIYSQDASRIGISSVRVAVSFVEIATSRLYSKVNSEGSLCTFQHSRMTKKRGVDLEVECFRVYDEVLLRRMMDLEEFTPTMPLFLFTQLSRVNDSKLLATS